MIFSAMFLEMAAQQMRMMRRLGGMNADVSGFHIGAIMWARKRGGKLRMKTGAPWKDGPRRR
ncbi:MAG: hypothetical protein KKH61_20670 [Gammaproteobacteria bacterium]|nr:hypothetical protein [Gammaproteobacteria bacterium]